MRLLLRHDSAAERLLQQCQMGLPNRIVLISERPLGRPMS